jgi:hypothetical protein
MSLIKTQQIIHINSAFRDTGTDSDFTYNLPIKRDNEFTHCAVISVSVPKSYYLVPEGENTFTIEENGSTFIVTIPPGNYNITSFIYVLNGLFTGQLSHYSVSFPDGKTEAQTGKMTFQHTNIQHDTDFIFGSNHLPEVMGFDRGSTNSFIINQTHSTLVSTNICNFQRESTIFLHSNLGSNGGQDDILLEMFASGNADLSNINFENNGNLEEHSKVLTNNLSTKFRFSLSDEYRSGINLNGVNMLITLCFYQKEDINRLMTGFIKYVTLYLQQEREEKEEKKKIK